jgi:uncharacterized protein
LVSPDDPIYEPAPPAAEREPISPLGSRLPSDENPPWSGWDVLGIAFLTIFSIVLFLFATTYAAQRLYYRSLPVVEVAKYPVVTVIAQLLAYLVVLAVMVSVVQRMSGGQFLMAIRWNWPQHWPGYLFGGVALSLALEGLARVLPMPKEMPIDRFFQTTTEAWTLSFFGMTFAPLLEELFFRGLLYPVLARRLGVVASVALTSVGFGLIHAPQLGRAWGPVLVVFLVGLALTIVRAVTKSVAAGLLMHIAYNATISLLLFGASDGFRHLEKLNH